MKFRPGAGLLKAFRKHSCLPSWNQMGRALLHRKSLICCIHSHFPFSRWKLIMVWERSNIRKEETHWKGKSVNTTVSTVAWILLVEEPHGGSSLPATSVLPLCFRLPVSQSVTPGSSVQCTPVMDKCWIFLYVYVHTALYIRVFFYILLPFPP